MIIYALPANHSFPHDLVAIHERIDTTNKNMQVQFANQEKKISEIISSQ